MKRIHHTTLGDLISLFYEEFMAVYGDNELAAVATAAVINDILSSEVDDDYVVEDAA